MGKGYNSGSQGEIMETFANVYRERGYYRVVLNVGATRMLGMREICFDKKNFAIRMPTIYDNKVYKIANEKTKNAAFVFTMEGEVEEDVVGKYLIEKEGDDYFMVKK